MADGRPHGFLDFVRSNGFHTIYLVTPERGWPLKVGISEDPVKRILQLQNAHYETLVFQRFWWLPGIAIASRIEADFKNDLAEDNIRGEWFKLNPERASEYIERAITAAGIRSLTQSEMEKQYDRAMRKRYDIRHGSPSPLRGSAPRTTEPWQKRKSGRRRQPWAPEVSWDNIEA